MRTKCVVGGVFLILFLPGARPIEAQINRDTPMFTPTIDGVITDAEMKAQLAVAMEWPVPNGALLLEGSGFGKEEISTTWYVSWDSKNLNLSGVVLDNTPDFRLTAGDGNVPYNAQDVIQPCFNPFANPDHSFNPDPGGGPAAIYDIVVNTADEFGPDIYRHGDTMEPEQHELVKLGGKVTATGYVLEAAIPWSVAMDDVKPDYVPVAGDKHGLSFIILSFNGEQGGTADIATLMTDFGDGANTIADPTTWNTITLKGSLSQPGDFDSNGTLDVADVDALSADISAGLNTPRFDLNSDTKVDQTDLSIWVVQLKKTWFGDSNLDGEFNSSDFVAVFTAGEYEDTLNGNSRWGTGDWNADLEFNSSDFVNAFQGGGFEKGPRAVVAAVPEPVGALGLLLGLLVALNRRRKRYRFDFPGPAQAC